MIVLAEGIAISQAVFIMGARLAWDAGVRDNHTTCRGGGADARVGVRGR